MKRGRLRAIFFDLDGTLAEDGDSIRQALNLACQIITRRWPEVDASSLAAIYRQVSDAAWGDYDRHLRHLVDPETMLASIWRTALAHWNRHDPAVEREAAAAYWSYRLQHCRPYPDVFPLVHDLFHNFRLCLLTNGAPAMQRAKVIAAGLTPFFPHIFVGGDFARGKPDQAIFQAALRATNCEPVQAVHIGDSLEHDIAGARNVGVHSVWLNRKEMKAATDSPLPDFEISALEDLPKCIESLSN